MIEDNKIVKTIEAKAGGKSGTYWTITWQDGKKDNVFISQWLPLLEQSQNNNQLLHLTKEKKGNYYNIISLELVALSEDIAKPQETPKPSPTKEASSEKVEHKSSPETGMWWKELGDMLRCGDIDKTTPQGKALRNAYYTEMFRVLGINIKEVQPTKRLVEEAMKLGKEVK